MILSEIGRWVWGWEFCSASAFWIFWSSNLTFRRRGSDNSDRRTMSTPRDFSNFSFLNRFNIFKLLILYKKSKIHILSCFKTYTVTLGFFLGSDNSRVLSDASALSAAEGILLIGCVWAAHLKSYVPSAYFLDFGAANSTTLRDKNRVFLKQLPSVMNF